MKDTNEIDCLTIWRATSPRTDGTELTTRPQKNIGRVVSLGSGSSFLHLEVVNVYPYPEVGKASRELVESIVSNYGSGVSPKLCRSCQGEIPEQYSPLCSDCEELEILPFN